MPAVWTTPRTWNVGLLVTAAMLNTYLRDNSEYLAANLTLPTGIVAFYLGGGTIPAGWHLSDGAGGTVDLRDAAIRGAGSTFAVGATGGVSQYAPGAHTTHVVTQLANHSNHVITQMGAHAQFDSPNTDLRPLRAMNHNITLNAHSAHTNMSITDTHTHTPVSVLPSYRARSAMQKIASGLSITTPKTWTTLEVPTAAHMNTHARDNVNYFLDRTMRGLSGIYWSGAVGTIPSAWRLVNGPGPSGLDLRDRFVFAAGSTYGHGTSGGAMTASLAAHTPHVVTQAAGHSNHVVGNPIDHTQLELDADAGADRPDFATITHTVTADAHSGGLHLAGDLSNHSNHDPIATLPAYIALAPIEPVSSNPNVPRTWTTSEIVTAADFNDVVRDLLAEAFNGAFPIGGIALWSGSLASVPAGWQLCNGAGGTPDTRDRFILGAGGVTTALTTGGANSSVVAAHSNHSATQPTAHPGHVITPPANHAATANTFNEGTPGSIFSIPDPHGTPTTDAHAHSGFGVDAHSGHANADVTPPYKAYAYIQRLS